MNSDNEWVGVAPEFSDWGVECPPRQFAERVTEQFCAERATPRRGGRAVVVPILLAAFFISFGAAAAWDVLRAEPSQLPSASSEAALDEGERAATLPVRVFHPDERAFAEPERAVEEEAEPTVSAVPLRVLKEPPKLEYVDTDEVVPVERILHLPACECGTSGVVCTCID